MTYKMYLLLILTLILTLTDPGTSYFIRPLVHKLARAGSSVAGSVGGALPDLELFFATISLHVDVAEKLSGPELKSGVWVMYNTK